MTATSPKTCTVVVSARGERCGKHAVVVRETFVGDVAECEEHRAPIVVAAPVVSSVGRRVQVRHCGALKVGVVVEEVGESRFAVEVPVKPHGRPAGRRVVRVERSDARFL